MATAARRPAPVAAPDVFAPADLGPIRLRNRVIKSATFEGRTPKALVTDELIDYHLAPAAGGVGMTTVAYCAVAPEGRTDRRQIYMRPEALPGLRRLTDAVHATGAAVSAQLGHAGPVANSASNRLPSLAPTRRVSPFGSVTQGATVADLERIVKAHAEAARLAAEAGFDAVELHFGHNYLASAFFSPKLNRRKDGYGGAVAGRARFAREIAGAVRAEVGGRLAILAKLNMDDGVKGGLGPDESVQVARWLEEDGTLDALVLTCGSSLLNPMYLFRGDAPVTEFANAFKGVTRLGLKMVGSRFLKAYPYEPLYMLDLARQFRAELTMPLVLLGGVTDKAGMDTAMAEGFQFVAMARALLREPDLVERLRKDPTTTSLCIHCNKCMPTIYSRSRCALIEPEA
ncbi:NADH:flavin oxidoreductase [Frankia sp. CN6]|uniref:NADH:flavin oxidoreductase n=1 Tax=Frankia nepalensis TaxID=1836974 RepID=A0A937RI92_9ACTN|nr:NADH:flavin oxidoreductase [Frankia nepalensis]